ncbi:DNA-directed RNA polymerase III subunit RPC7 isoform X2 [Petaurus breviceps papuanus]|uniref:DNA-directed RNA polymerase III subunit RPC7 isoform X2 n=1 Tax=Petaurus breviceps papuanus TaxID=3040969 RepID=UPI0036DBFA26
MQFWRGKREGRGSVSLEVEPCDGERLHSVRVLMAGNKGRGRASFTFNIEAIGFSRGEKLPDVVLKPPPLYPDTDYKPVPLKAGEAEEYMLALKQEFRATMKRMPYFMDTEEEKQEIERYSKRYLKNYREDDLEWVPDWRRLPREMMPRKKLTKGPKRQRTKGTAKVTTVMSTVDVLKKIEDLEKKGDEEKSDEETDEKEGGKGKRKDDDDDDEDEAADEQEEYDEEEQEEENDYINSYFDNGDDFGAESDDNMDEATY